MISRYAQTPATQTPWGPAPSAMEIAPGIVNFRTESHGGAHVDLSERMTWPAPLREFQTFAGENWYEEDCDFHIVILARPDAFPIEHVRHAVNFAREYCKTYAPAVSKWIDSDERRAVKIRAMLGEPVPA